MKNYELSNDQQISTPFIFDILQGTVLHTFQDNILDKYSRENFRIPSYTSLANTTPFRTIIFLNLSRSGQGTGYGERKIHTYIPNIKALITVRTTSSRPSTKMSAFMLCMYFPFSVAGALARA